MFREHDTPPGDRIERCVGIAEEVILDGDVEGPVRKALVEPTGYADTHPALRDRLRGMGFEVGAGTTLEELERMGLRPEPGGENALSHFFGERTAGLLSRLSKELDREAGNRWREIHAEFAQMASQLADLEAKAAAGGLTGDDRFLRANLLGTLRGDAAGRQAWEDILSEEPDSIPANYQAGVQRLQDGDDSGIGLLAKVMAADPESRLECCGIIAEYLRRSGREKEADAYLQDGDATHELVKKLQEERGKVSPGDRFEPHDLTEAQVSELAKACAGFALIKEAVLVKRRLRNFEGEHNYVLGFRLKALKQSEGNSNRAVQCLLKAMEAALAGKTQAYFFVFDAADSSFWKAYNVMIRVPGAVIFKL